MAFTKSTATTNTIGALPDKPTISATALKAKFDAYSSADVTYINSLIDELESVVDGSSGADSLGMTVITETGTNATVQSVIEALITRLKAVTDSASGADLIGMTVITETGANATVQSVIEALITRLKAITDSASGADLIGTTTVSGITGNTVQSILEALKVYVDDLDGANVKLTGDQTVAGIKTFSSSPIVPTPTTDYQAGTKKYTDDTVADAVLGNLPDNSIENAKLVPDIKVGSLALLTTTEKASVVGSVNEIDASVTAVETKTDFITVTQAVDLDTMESGIATNTGDLTTSKRESDVIKINQNTSLTYTSGDLTNVKEYWTDGTTVKVNTDLTYTSGNLTQVVTKYYNESEVLQKTATEALTYTSGDLTSVERTVA